MNINEILQTSKTIAVVGLSPDESKPSHYVSKFLQSRGYKIYPIYPKFDEILGEKVYRNLSEISAKIDIVVMFRKGEFAPILIDEVIKKGVKTLWLQLGITNEKAKIKALENSINFVQDRCIMIELSKLKGEILKDYSHITKFENILDSNNEALKKADDILENLEKLVPKFKELVEYYYSDQRDNDLKDDDLDKIPNSIKRGVLSEDEIYNMMINYRETAIKMLEVATSMLKA